MKTMLRLTLTLLLCLTLALCLGGESFAETVDSGDWGGMAWTLDDAGTLTITGTGDMDDFSNDPTDAWHRHKWEIQTLVIGEGVTGIGRNAFESCVLLTSARLPAGLTDIDDYAFFGCSRLTDVTLPNTLARIGDFSFAYCVAMTDLPLPGTLQNIGEAAFLGSYNLTDVMLPAGLSSIGDYAYAECFGVTGFSVAAANPSFCAEDGVVFTADRSELVLYPVGRDGEYTIPAGVTGIGPCAFYSAHGLTSLTVPESLESIGARAFARAFEDSPERNVIFRGDAPAIDATTFSDVTARAHYLTSKNWSDETRQGYGGTLTWVPHSSDSGTWNGFAWTLDDAGTLTVTGSGAMPDFQNDPSDAWHTHEWEILTLVVGEGVTSIGSNAFESCIFLADAELPAGLTGIGDYAFFSCTNLSDINIPASVTRIGSFAFSACDALTSVELPSGLREIGSAAFSPSGLTSVTVPGSVTSIGDYAFSDCTALTSAEIQPGVANIGDSAFRFTALTSVSIPGSVTRIGDYAFMECYSLQDVNIPEGVTYIGEGAFYGGSMMQITIPGSVSQIGTGAFSNCALLMDVTLSEGVTYIGNSAFESTGLWELTIPASVTTIGEGAFSGNFNLQRVIFRGDAPAIGNYCFFFDTANVYYPAAASWPESVRKDYNGRLTWIAYYDELWGGYDLTPDLDLPADLTEIGAEAFRGGAFTTVQLSEAVVSLAENAFADCPDFAYIYIPAATTDIDPNAFGDRTELTIFGRIGSRAESFAAEHAFTFVPIA